MLGHRVLWRRVILAGAVTTAASLTVVVGFVWMLAFEPGVDQAARAAPLVEATVTPCSCKQPPGNENVTWAVESLTFDSHYPQGFTFTAIIRSSAAPVERARVVWSHAPGTQRSRAAELDPASGVLSVVWEPRGGDAIPPWLGIAYQWEVTDEAGNTFKTDVQQAEYADLTRTWRRFESDDVIVFVFDLSDDVGQQTIEAMAVQREIYRAAWGDLLPYKPRAILFGSRAAWREWQIGASVASTIGTTRADWGATVQVVSGTSVRNLAYGTVLHEIAHLYQFEFAGTLPVTWFVEGNAAYFEISRMYDYGATARALAMRGELPALLRGTGPGVSGQKGRQGYDIGYSFFVWLVDNYGLEGHQEVMSLLSAGMPRNLALETVTDLSVQQIEEQWRSWLGASTPVPTLAPTPTRLFFPSPTPFKPGS